METNKYLTCVNELARVVGKQKALKRERQSIQRRISRLHQRFDDNGLKVDGRDLIPRRPALELTRSVSSLGRIERLIQTQRIEIQKLEKKILAMKVRRAFAKAAEKAFIGITPTPRQLLQMVLKQEGLFLHENGEVSGQGGKLVGTIKKIWTEEDKLKFTYKPIKALDFILVDMKI